MNLKDCYSAVGGDFDEVMGRLRKEQLVTKFLYKFLDDKNFHLTKSSGRESVNPRMLHLAKL